MQRKIEPSEDRALQEDDRAEWTRPALYRLKASGAEGMQKKSMDGAQGKGGAS